MLLLRDAQSGRWIRVNDLLAHDRLVGVVDRLDLLLRYDSDLPVLVVGGVDRALVYYAIASGALARELREGLLVGRLESLCLLVRVLNKCAATATVLRPADDCPLLHMPRLLPRLLNCDAGPRRLRAQFASLLHLGAALLHQLRRRRNERILALLRRAVLHQVHLV